MSLLAAPAAILAGFVTIAAIVISMAMAIRVARTRRATGVRAPAMSGSPDLECALRVQGNTVEQMTIFLPALWLAVLWFQGWLPPALGALWCIGRVIYMLTYGPGQPTRRAPGFIVSMLSVIALSVLAAIGLVQAWMASGVAV
jgi:glutathione S-transferase